MEIFMKFVVFCLLILSCSSLFADKKGCDCFSLRNYDCFIIQVGDKIYLDEDSIFLQDRKICVDVEGHALELNAIFTDTNGIYFSRLDQSQDGWNCPICFAEYVPGTLICIKNKCLN